MGHSAITGNIDGIVIEQNDHVATALRDLEAGQQVVYRLGDEKKELILRSAIPFGHKFAIVYIKAGQLVRKYGEVIGQSTIEIQVGDHVHVHNIEGIRGRGDKVERGESA